MDYEYDVEYEFSDFNDSDINNVLENDHVVQEMIMTSPNLVTTADYDESNHFTTMTDDNIEYVLPDVPNTMDKTALMDDKEYVVNDNNVIQTDRQAVVVTNQPVNQVTNLTATDNKWKKPLVIGAALFAAWFFFKED